MYRNLVLSGGAFKATAFIGCIKFLEARGLCQDLINVIGSSAGAIVALMFVIGLTSEQMTAFVIEELEHFQKNEIDLENVLDLFYNLGVEDGTKHVFVFERLLAKKEYDTSITFLQLIKSTGKNLVICGANVSDAREEYFSADSVPDMRIIDALRISISVPFLLTPVVHNDSLYVDASLFDNFPTQYFSDSIKRPFTDTIAICISSNETRPDLNNLNLLSYTHLILNAIFKRLNPSPCGLTEKTNRIIKILNNDALFDTDTFKLIADTDKVNQYIQDGLNAIAGAGI